MSNPCGGSGRKNPPKGPPVQLSCLAQLGDSRSILTRPPRRSPAIVEAKLPRGGNGLKVDRLPGPAVRIPTLHNAIKAGTPVADPSVAEVRFCGALAGDRPHGDG